MGTIFKMILYNSLIFLLTLMFTSRMYIGVAQSGVESGGGGGQDPVRLKTADVSR